MKRYLPILIALLAIGCFTAMAFACPMCKDSVPNSDAQSSGGVPSGFNISVYLLLGSFLGVLGLLVGGIFRAVHTTRPARGFPVEAHRPTDGSEPR